MLCRIGLIFLLALPAHPQIRAWVQSNQQLILREFTDLLSIPNVSNGAPNIRKNAEFIRAMFERRGVTARLLETEGAPPVVFGELKSPNAKRTVVFYAHYDGQPITRSQWDTDPFTPTLKGDRIYGRSTSDDKAAILAMAAALDALRAANLPPKVNIKFFFEGEEEISSPHLDAIVRKHAPLLASDLWLICDGPVHQNGQHRVVFGARGVLTTELTVYGADRELHSGHYGGWAPNPAVMLAHLIASMRDDNGRVLIPDFYTDIPPLTAAEKQAIAAIPSVDDQLQQQFGLKRRENSGRSIDEIVNEPTLNIRGLRSADTGPQSRNVVPAWATASIDVRLVKGISPEQALDRIIAHVKRQGYFTTDKDPDAGARLAYPKIAKITKSASYPATKTAMDLPIALDAIKAIEAAVGKVIRTPTMGGSVPLYAFEQILHAPLIVVPIANYDNNQHAANENIRLQNLWSGIEVMAALMTMQ
jgi:acetylornithine deacetylase/succinyl-diaminopimelate desuccinylase-like protein